MVLPSRLILIAVGACLISPGTVNSATTSGTMAVSATVVALCTVAATPLAFGLYASTQTDASSTITVACTTGTSFSVILDAGTGTGATTVNRLMTGPAGSTLRYNLSSNAGRNINWGNTVGTDSVANIGTGAAQVLNVYGRIPASQIPAPGVYSDSVTVTLTY